ncbi:MAG: NnrS family protein [Vicinamibacterales bacterium]
MKHTPSPVHAAAVPARVFVPFLAASLVLTLTWGATLGMINLARLTAGWGLGTLPRPSVWAHAYVQVFGFMALFVMGVAYHVIPRFVSGTLQHARLVPWSFWLQLGGVVAIACGFFHDSALTRPLWIAGSASLVVASAFFCDVMLRTLESGTPAREPFRWWIIAGACWLPLSAALALTTAIADDVTWHRMLWTAALFGFITSWIFGVGRRILPIFLGCQPRWGRVEPAVFILYQAGVVAWVVGAWPSADSQMLNAARGAGAILLIASVVAYTATLGLFARIGSVLGCAIRNPQDGWQKYVFAAWGWLFVSLALGPAWTLVRLVTGGTEPLLLYDFARHAMAFGFAAQMVVGVASRVVPNFSGKPLWSSHLRDASFYLLNASMAVRALQVPIASGIWTQAWNHIAWSGPLGVMAILSFTVNIFMTIRQQPSPVLQPELRARVLQPLVARK